AMQFHYVDGAIPRDDVMSLRGKRVAPVGIARLPTYLQDVQGKVDPFAFLFHDGFFHAPQDSAKRGIFPEATHRLYRLLQRHPVDPSENTLSHLSELIEWTNEDGSPNHFGRVLPALTRDILAEARKEPDVALRNRDLNEIHRLTQALEGIAARLPEAGPQAEAQAEFAAQVAELRRALDIDSLPRNIEYPPELEAAWQRVEAAWAEPAYFNGSREELAARRPHPDDVDAIWLHQAMDYVRRRGAEPEVFDIGELRYQRNAEGQPLFDSDFFDQVMAVLGERGREGSLARRVVRARFNDRLISDADMKAPHLRYLDLSPMIGDVTAFTDGRLSLSESRSDSALARVDYPSLSLTEAVLRAAAGDRASQFHPVPGTISRDRTISYRSKRVSPVGMARGLIHIEHLGHEVHPLCFTGHDAMFHAVRDSEHSDPFPEVGGWYYRALERRLPPGRLREVMLDNLADSNFGGVGGALNEFLDAALDPLRMAILDSQKDRSFEERRAAMEETSAVLGGLRTILAEDAPGQPFLAPRVRIFSDHLDRYSRQLERVRRVAEEYRAAGVEVSPPLYDMATLDAIERIESRFREPGYLEGSREELKRKRVDLADADKLWAVQARDFIRLIPQAADPTLSDVTYLLRPPAGRHDYNVQDVALLEGAIARLERKGAIYDEARGVTLINLPASFMVTDLEYTHPERKFLRFDTFLNDLEAHLNYR
ncbi:MAG TPA: hypothetical protein VJR29_00370, partial [bacterium]|nr:hypothetical protein [bacterium]